MSPAYFESRELVEVRGVLVREYEECFSGYRGQRADFPGLYVKKSFTYVVVGYLG